LERGISIGLIAPKGGVGVSTVALNATIALHNANRQSVALADFRPGCGAIGAEVGLVNPQGLNRLLAFPPEEISPALIEAELVEHPSGIKLLPASSDPLDAQRIAEVDKFAAIAEQLPYLAYYTLFDLGAGLTPINVKVLSTCQQVLLVFEPIGQTVQQARLMFNYLVERGLPAERITPILVNRQRAGMQLSLGQTQDQFGRSIPIVFTAAPELAYQSQVSSTPMILRQPDGVTAQQFNSLALRMVQLAR
jgi:pilus assembly protein CpaE